MGDGRAAEALFGAGAPVSDFFRQKFAQVNKPIAVDSLRANSRSCR